MFCSFAISQWFVNSGLKWALLLLFVLVNGICFTLTVVYYETAKEFHYHRLILRGSLSISRGAAACLNLNLMLLLFPVCRNLLSYVRHLCYSRRLCKRSFRRLLDDGVTFHKLVGRTICFFTIIHIHSHYNNIENFAKAWIIPRSNNTLLLSLSKLKGGDYVINPVRHPTTDILIATVTMLPGWTGILLVVILIVMFVTATKYFRKYHYESFWFSHHLYVVFFMFFILHGMSGVISPMSNLNKHDPLYCQYRHFDWNIDPKCAVPTFYFTGSTSWKWIIAPLIIFASEKLLRLRNRFISVEIVDVNKHSFQVIELQLKKKGFSALPGQYVCILVPQVSRLQWHPFTLTSAPDDNYFSVHIRVVGDWTRQVEELYSPYYFQPDAPLSERSKWPEVFIDGPFGSATESVEQYNISVLIGCGIGVTPFCSVLKKLLYSIKMNRDLGKLCHMKFYWICPRYNAFEWFADMIQEVEQCINDQRADFLDIHIHLTALLSRENSEEVVRRQRQSSIDMFTGLHSKTVFGRPNWQEEFQSIVDNYSNKSVGVFFCGPPKLSSELNSICNNFSGTNGTYFYFNKEHF